MNQMKKIIAALFLATLLLSACKSSKEASSNSNEFIKESTKEVTTVEKWIVAGEKVNCPETSTELCYQIKKFGRLLTPSHLAEGMEECLGVESLILVEFNQLLGEQLQGRVG